MRISEYKKVTKCRICKSSRLYKFLDYGSMPLANKFLEKSEFSDEKFYPLTCLFCKDCYLVQLGQVVSPKILFEDYPYVPSGSGVLMNDFNNLALEVDKRLNLSASSFVVDIGSNDGSLLSIFKNLGVRVLGIDPAHNLAKVAKDHGIATEVGLFNTKMAREIHRKFGQADLVCATNVVAHVDDVFEFLEAVSILLAQDGLFVCEFPYILDLVIKNEFDTIYHEHLSYFSLGSWQRLIKEAGFEIIDAKRVQIHGGSLRITNRLKKAETKPARRTINYLLWLEKQHGLTESETFGYFSDRVLKLKDEFTRAIHEVKVRDKRIVGLGAAAKASIVTNFFGLGPEAIDYIADSTPFKIGKYTPGKHIPIYSEEKVFFDKPDYCLIFAWNFADEIMRKYRKLRRKGTKFIVPIPEVKII